MAAVQNADFNNASRIIKFAYWDCGKIQRGDLPDSDQYDEAMQRLNDIINLEQTQGLKVFLNEMITVPMTAGKATYVIGPAGDVVMAKPLQVLEGYYIQATSGAWRPLQLLSWNTYNGLSNKTQQGAITSFFPDKQSGQINLTLWLVPDSTAATGTIQFLIRQQATQMLSLTDTISFPQEWFMYLRWALADDLATGQPQAIMDRCASRTAQFREALEGWDQEDGSVTFTPDPMQGAGSRFR